MPNPSPWSRIEEIIRSTGHQSVSSFARSIGLKRGENLFQIKRGNNGISLALAQKIHNAFPQYNLGWILAGDGEPTTSNEPGAERTIPFYLSWNLNANQPDSMLRFPSSMLGGATLAVQNPDDGLASRYDKGCILFLCEAGEIIYGKPYLLMTESALLVRIIKKGEYGLLLVSDNIAKYDDFEISRDKVKMIYTIYGALII